ncbi:MAG: ATP-binding protein, partial [Pseudonocardiaceae bacterium]
LSLALPDEPVECEVDSRRVARILRNLVTTAVEYGRAAPADDGSVVRQVVEINVAASESAVAIVVRDYGIGLATHECEAVFHRFWRGDPSRARHTGGTGLGLSIALEDARLHGGWLQAWGRRGAGAQFRLTLPRYAGNSISSSPLPLVPVRLQPVQSSVQPHFSAAESAETPVEGHATGGASGVGDDEVGGGGIHG